MAVIDGRTPRGFAKENNLPFEGFLEALCRLSMLKALPTDEELAAAEEPDAGRYLAWLAMEQEDAYDELIESRAVPWGGEPYQPVERCVRHMLAVIWWRMQKAPHPDRERSGNLPKMIGQYFSVPYKTRLKGKNS